MDSVFGELHAMSHEVVRALGGMGNALLLAFSTGSRIATKQERPAAMLPHVFAFVGFGVTLVQALDKNVESFLRPFAAPAAGFSLALLYLFAVAIVVLVARRRRSPWRLVMPLIYGVCFTGMWWPSERNLPTFLSAFVLSLVGLVGATMLSRKISSKATRKAPHKYSIS